MKTWAEIISDLQQSGMTYAEIGEAAGTAGSTIGDLASGRSKSPRGNAAIKLHALHSLRQAPSAVSAPDPEPDDRDQPTVAAEGNSAAGNHQLDEAA